MKLIEHPGRLDISLVPRRQKVGVNEDRTHPFIIRPHFVRLPESFEKFDIAIGIFPEPATSPGGVGAIHTQVLKRPLVIEKERINFD